LALAVLACAHAPATPAGADPVKAYADVNGVHMYYEIHGRGRPVLLLHGGMVGQSLWPKTIAALARGHEVIAPEQMGHGHTPDVPSREFSYAQMAQDTVALLEKLQIAQVDVVGWSDGGMLGYHGHRASGPRPPAGDVGRERRRRGHAAAKVERVAAGRPAPFFQEAYAKFSPDGPQHYSVLLNRMVKMWRRYPYVERARLKEIRCPTLIIAGDRDFIPQEQAMRLAQAIPGAQLMIVPGTGHGTFLQRPELMNLELLEFLDAPDDRKKNSFFSPERERRLVLSRLIGAR
jgi:pimeloyl-ACP methyl ester carboxylesterase